MAPVTGKSSSDSILFYNGPLHFLVCPKRSDLFAITKVKGRRNLPRFLFQRHGGCIARQTVMIGAVGSTKIFQLVECTRQFKGFGIEFDGRMSRKDAGTATRSFFILRGVGCRIRAQKEFGRPRRGRTQESYTMWLGFENLQNNKRACTQKVRQQKSSWCQRDVKKSGNNKRSNYTSKE